MAYLLYVKHAKISAKIIVFFLIVTFLVGYLSGIDSFFKTIFDLPINTIGGQILAGLFVTVISLLFLGLWRLFIRGPFTILIPALRKARGIISKREMRNLFNFKGMCIIKNNGIIAKGLGSNSNSVMEYKQYHKSFTISADFKAKVVIDKEKYWRYGIEIINKNDQIANFHLDNDDLIVLYLEKKLYLRYKSEFSLSNKTVRIKIYISNENNTRIISFFINDSLIYQKIDNDNFEDCSLKICAWSDHMKYHNVRIRNICISK